MRMFVAAIPPAEVLEDLDGFLAPRREAAPFRWTVAAQLHLTLAFSEHVPDRCLDDVVDGLERASAKRTAIDLRVTGGGAFPHPDLARVIFADLMASEEGHEELSRLATGCRTALARAGARVDGRAFRPHVTVARLARPANVSDWVRLLDAYSGPPWLVGEVALVASHLGEGPRRRPRHEVVATFPLGGQPEASDRLSISG